MRYRQKDRAVAITTDYYLSRAQREEYERHECCVTIYAWQSVNEIVKRGIDYMTEHKHQHIQTKRAIAIIQSVENLDTELFYYFTGLSEQQIELYVKTGKGNDLIPQRLKTYINYFIEEVEE